MAEEPDGIIRFKWKGDLYEVDPYDLTASEFLAFKQATGSSLESEIVNGQVGPWVMAGIVWLIRRRRAKGLPYAQVADELTMRDIEQVVPDAEPEPEAAGAEA